MPMGHHQKNSKSINSESNFVEKNLKPNKMIRIVNSRQTENQNPKPFGYSTENHFSNQKYFFNSNFNNNKNNNGIYQISFLN